MNMPRRIAKRALLVAALVVGMLCGFWFYGIVAAYVIDYVTSRAIANLIGFFVILIGVLILGAIIGRILAKVFKWVGLSWLDRLLGGAFGIVRGFLIAAVIVSALVLPIVGRIGAQIARFKFTSGASATELLIDRFGYDTGMFLDKLLAAGVYSIKIAMFALPVGMILFGLAIAIFMTSEPARDSAAATSK